MELMPICSKAAGAHSKTNPCLFHVRSVSEILSDAAFPGFVLCYLNGGALCLPASFGAIFLVVDCISTTKHTSKNPALSLRHIWWYFERKKFMARFLHNKNLKG